MKVYKIQRISDGLYSTGGVCPSFTKKGKVWNGIGPLKNHLNLWKIYTGYHNCPYKPESAFKVVCIDFEELVSQRVSIDLESIK